MAKREKSHAVLIGHPLFLKLKRLATEDRRSAQSFINLALERVVNDSAAGQAK